MSDSSLLRKRGLQALAGHWQTALLITFAAGILGMAISVLQTRIMSQLGSAVTNPLDILENWGLQAGSYQTMIFLLGLLEILFAPALSIGLNHYYLELHGGREARFSLLFSRMRIFGKCLGQALIMGLLIALWFLVGLFPCIILLYLIRIASPFLVWVMSLAAMIPALIALLRYAMAPYLLAEDPELGVMDTIRQSKDIMDGNKGRLFILYLSFTGWLVLSVGLIVLLNSLLNTIGLALGLFASLALQVYIHSTVAAFYLELPTRMTRPEKPEWINAT